MPASHGYGPREILKIWCCRSMPTKWYPKKLETFTRPPFLGLFQVSLTGKGLQPWPCHHVTPCVLMTQGVFFSGRELWPQTVAEPESEPDSGGQEDLVNGVSGKIWCWKKNNFYCRWSSKQQGACTPSPLSASQLLIYISVVAPFYLYCTLVSIEYLYICLYLSTYLSTHLPICLSTSNWSIHPCQYCFHAILFSDCWSWGSGLSPLMSSMSFTPSMAARWLP